MAAIRFSALKILAPVAFTLFLASCSLPFGKQPITPKPPVPVVSSSAKSSSKSAIKLPMVKPVDVSITAKAFDPAKVTVKKGTPVRWINKDKAAHQVRGDKPTYGLYSVKLDSGMTFAHVFTEPGTYTYNDILNPKLKGTVVVTK